MSKQRIRLTEGQLHNVIRKCINEAIDQAAYENACDSLYYGEGFNSWRQRHDYLDPVEADQIWHAAFKKMSEDNSAPFTPHSIESYDWQQAQNDNELNVSPDDNGFYPDENWNVSDSPMYNNLEKRPFKPGEAAITAQGGGNNKLLGMKSIIAGSTPKSRGMGLASARDEYEKNFDNINATKSAKDAWKQGRIGNERPLHRKGSLNRAMDETLQENWLQRKFAQQTRDFDNRPGTHQEKCEKLSWSKEPLLKGATKAMGAYNKLKGRPMFDQDGEHSYSTDDYGRMGRFMGKHLAKGEQELDGQIAEAIRRTIKRLLK